MKVYSQYRNIFELWNSKIRNTAIIRLVPRYKSLEIFILVMLSQIIVGSCALFWTLIPDNGSWIYESESMVSGSKMLLVPSRI